MSLSRFIQGNEILRHLFRPDGQSYAWFRIKELILFLCSHAGTYLVMFLLISSGVWVSCLALLSFGIWAGLIILPNVTQFCTFVSVAIGLPLSAVWFRRLIKQEEESCKVTQELMLMQRDYSKELFRTWGGVAEAFSIFAKYGLKSRHQSINLQGNMLLAGPNPKEVSEEDRARLTELGWEPLERFGCFFVFIN
jgi:hypothetical protein